MIDPLELKKMASLAHIAFSDEELTAMAGDIDKVLAYVSEVKGVPETETRQEAHRNVMRADEEPETPSEWSERLLKAAPRVAGRHIATNVILKND